MNAPRKCYVRAGRRVAPETCAGRMVILSPAVLTRRTGRELRVHDGAGEVRVTHGRWSVIDLAHCLVCFETIWQSFSNRLLTLTALDPGGSKAGSVPSVPGHRWHVVAPSGTPTLGIRSNGMNRKVISAIRSVGLAIVLTLASLAGVSAHGAPA